MANLANLWSEGGWGNLDYPYDDDIQNVYTESSIPIGEILDIVLPAEQKS